MRRRNFLKSLAIGWAYLSLPRLSRADGYQIRILDQHNNPAALNGTIYLPSGKSSPIVNGIANIPILYLHGDVNQDGILFGKDDLSLVYQAAARVVPPDSINSDANADGKITANDALRFYKSFKGDSTAVSQQPIAGQVYYVPVSLAGDETYLGVTNYHMRVEKDQIPYVKVFKNGPVTEPYLSRRYADARDLFGKLVGLEMQMVDKGSIIRRWQRIIIDYGQYTFANIDHAEIMRDEARRINEKIGLVLFNEGRNGHVIVDYSMDRSAVEYSLYDAEGNPAKAIVYKKKYCGAENWSRAEAQRLLLSLAMGINLDDQFFPDEHIAVEKQDARLPDEVWDALKALYNLPIGLDIKVFDRGGEKPAIYVDGKAEINSPIKLVVVVPDGASVPTLEYLVAEKTTREFWSAESADEQPKYQGTNGGRGHIFTFNTEWPGPRRFRATALINGSAIEGLNDINVKADRNPDYHKGLPIGAFLEFMQYNQDMYLLSTLNRFYEAGVDTMVYSPEWYVDDLTKTNIHPVDGFIDGYIRTWPDELLIKLIKYAKNIGMKVILKPGVWAIKDYTGWSWAGVLHPENDDWDGLFVAYTNFILHYARLAEQLSVDYMIIGTELSSMCIPNWDIWVGPDGPYKSVSNPDSRWRKVIEEIRKVYNGKLTMALASNQYGGYIDSVNFITWWDALDYIGVEAYYGLTGGDDPINFGQNDPSLQELAEGFQYMFNRAFLPVLKKYGKKAIITEVNYYTFDGVNRNPIGVSGPRNDIVDFKEQADCCNALLRYVANDDNIEAIVTFGGFVYADSDLIKYHKGWDGFFIDRFGNTITDWLYGKPAEKIIQANWKA